MYFSNEEAGILLRSIKDLMCHQSVLWFDFVSKSAVVDATGEPEVKNFMDSMRMIGEPFIKGFDDVSEELNDVGLDVFELATAKEVLNSSDPVTRHYSFALCRANRMGRWAVMSRRFSVGVPYVIQAMSNKWRVVVPIRGKLSPLVCREVFHSRTDAEEFMNSADGQEAILKLHGLRGSSRRLEPIDLTLACLHEFDRGKFGRERNGKDRLSP